jgi:hypothetical protein
VEAFCRFLTIFGSACLFTALVLIVAIYIGDGVAWIRGRLRIRRRLRQIGGR